MLKCSFLFPVLLIVACSENNERDGDPTPSERRVAVAVSDTMSTAMRRALDEFRTTVPGPPPSTIQGGAQSRDQLVRKFVDAVQRADTAALIRMTVTRAESHTCIIRTRSIRTHPTSSMPTTAGCWPGRIVKRA